MAAVAYAEGHYHNTINSIGRGTGYAPIVAKAAYRAGECLFDERTGQWHDYRYKADRVIEKFITLPEGAAAWGFDRNRLWNASEAAEPRKNGRNATELELALPHALTHEQRHDMLSAYVREKVEKYGIAADVAVHFGRDGNIHAHVVLSHRQFGAEGFGEPCNAHTVSKKRKGQWKKETVYGISANPDAVKELRREWADFQNAWFEKLDLNVRVDHRSFDERGIKQTPTVHLGPNAAALEARGIRTDRGDINRMIEVGNAELHRLEAEARRQDAEIIDFQKAKAAREAQQPTTPRTDEAEKNYSKRQGDEIAAEKELQPMPDDPANQNKQGPQPMAVGLSVPLVVAPETLAASHPAAIDRIVDMMPGRRPDSSPHLEHRSDAGTDELGRRTHRRPESEDMDEDIASKQRQERQAIEDRQAASYIDMVVERNRADRYLQEWQRDHENGERNKRHLQEAQWRRESESDITDVRARALIAAGESRDFVQAVRREGAMITEEHADLQRQIALENDPDKKHLLELKRDVQHADYMALANERIAAMSNLNGDQYKEAQRQQEAWSNIGTDLRKRPA